MSDYISIDYSEIRESLLSDLEDKTLTEDSMIYVTRHRSKVNIKGKDRNPIIDYFYAKPEIDDKLTEMTVLEAKKLMFDARERYDDDFSRETLDLMISDLQDYTKNRPNRNNRKCFLLFTSETRFPIMLYFEDEEVQSTLSLSKLSDILNEIDECFL